MPLDSRVLSEVIGTAVVSKHFRLLAEFDIIDLYFSPTFKIKIYTFCKCFRFVFSIFKVFYQCQKLGIISNFNGPTSIHCWRYKMAKWREGSQENKRKTLKQHG